MAEAKKGGMAGGFIGERAIVVGAGMGGLLAARVLLDRFERVALIERDALTDRPAIRKGVPQGRHLHSLAVRGGDILEQYFPGLDAELEAAGCPAVDQAADTITELSTGRLPRFRSRLVMRAVSRALIEQRVRRRLEVNDRLVFLGEREAAGLLRDGRKERVTGVRVSRKGSGRVEGIEGDLVVDASGQGSRAPRWLAELGYGFPEETVVDARLGYSTQWFRIPEDFEGDWKGITVLPGWPEETRGGTLRQVEGGVWTAVLIGMNGDYPPTDGDGFLEFARSLSSQAFYNAIKRAEPVSPVYGYRRTANRRHHYERMCLPGRFIVIGDAATALNPSYGTGMTAAALSARALENCLSKVNGPRGLDNLGRRFHRAQIKAIAPCWMMTVTSDRQWSAGSVGALGPADRLLHRLSAYVMELAVEREDVACRLLEAKNVVRSPLTLVHPGTLLSALLRAVRPVHRPKRRALPGKRNAGQARA